MKELFTKVFLLLLLSLYTTTLTQEPGPAQCDGKSIKYSIVANMKDYLQYENNIDQREIYTKGNLSSLYNKQIGIYTQTYQDSEKLKDYKNKKKYDNKDELVSDLINHKIDGGIMFLGHADPIKMTNNMLTFLNTDLYTVNCGFGLQKNKDELKNKINTFIQGYNGNAINELLKKWHPMNFENGYVDTNLMELIL